MGEIISIEGTPVKLGTCEDLYYARYEEIERVVASGRTARREGNLAPAAYLTAAGFRYRFPFPEEDGQEWTKWMGRDFDNLQLNLIERDSLAAKGSIEALSDEASPKALNELVRVTTRPECVRGRVDFVGCVPYRVHGSPLDESGFFEAVVVVVRQDHVVQQVDP